MILPAFHLERDDPSRGQLGVLMKRVLLSLGLMVAACSATHAQTQVVYLDFDSQTGGLDHVYTGAERTAIQTQMEQDYALFNYSFTQTTPGGGDFSTVVFNDGPALGDSDAIDFRNLDRNDNATVNVNAGAVTSSEFIVLTANVASHELGHISGLRHGDSFGPIGSGIDPNTVMPNEYFGSSRAATRGGNAQPRHGKRL
ncbi:MAG: hypothetical protein N2C14_22095 [Planctomycetales bacterium]